MSATPRNPPRFIPTLTEVVQPSDLSTALAPPMPDLEEIVQAVMQRVRLATERRVREETETMVRALVIAQTQDFSARLHRELEGLVRKAVADALISGADLHKMN